MELVQHASCSVIKSRFIENISAWMLMGDCKAWIVWTQIATVLSLTFGRYFHSVCWRYEMQDWLWECTPLKTPVVRSYQYVWKGSERFLPCWFPWKDPTKMTLWNILKITQYGIFRAFVNWIDPFWWKRKSSVSRTSVLLYDFHMISLKTRKVNLKSLKI